MNTIRRSIADVLDDLGACNEAIEWAEGQDDPRAAWESCERGDWLLWICGKLDVDRRLLVTAACRCARLALRYVPSGEYRPLIAIEMAEAWIRGEATIDQVRNAADAAYAYASAASAAAAASAAYAAYAATAASAAAAYAAADAAADAAYASAAAAYAARGRTLAECADLVRTAIDWPVVEALIPEGGDR